MTKAPFPKADDKDANLTFGAQEYQAQFESLLDLIEQINRKPELTDVLRTVVLHMSQLFDFDRVSVVLFQPGDDIAFVIAEQENSILENLVVRIQDYPEIDAVIKSRKLLVIPDVLGDTLLEGVREKLKNLSAPPRTSVLFPLLHRDDVVGVLFLRTEIPRVSVSTQIAKMGRLIASVTAVAIGSALEQDTLLSEQRALRRKKEEVDQKLAGLQQFSEYFAQARDGIIVTDRSGMIRYVNKAAGTILKRDEKSLRQTRFIDLLSTDSRHLGERALKGDAVGDNYGYVDLIVPIDEFDKIVLSAAIRTLEKPEGVLTSFRDVTELREIETELRQTKEFLENLIQSSVDAIVAADVNGHVVLFNRAAEQFLGYSAQESVGQLHVSSLYPPGEAQDVMRRLRSEAYGGQGRLEMTRKELVAKSGEQVPVSLTASIIYEGDQEIATVGVFTDLRERIKIEEKLSQVQHKLQFSERQAVAVELAGAAAHELNQPLTSIMGYSELLKRRVPPDSPHIKAIETIYRETERMATIVRKIGQITSYETKDYVGGSQIIDLDESK